MEANAVVAKNCWNKSIPKRVCTENSTLTKQLLTTVVLGCMKNLRAECRWFSSSTKFIWSGPTFLPWHVRNGSELGISQRFLEMSGGGTHGIFWDTLIHQPFGSTRLPFVVPWFSFLKMGISVKPFWTHDSTICTDISGIFIHLYILYIFLKLLLIYTRNTCTW